MNSEKLHLKNYSCGCGCQCVNRTIPNTKQDTGRLSRRQFLELTVAMAGGIILSEVELGAGEYGLIKEESLIVKQPLVVQPVLVYSVPKRREGTSWRNWGAIQTTEQAKAEVENITKELKQLEKSLDFLIKFQPLRAIQTVQEAEAIRNDVYDVMLLYAAGGWVNILEALTSPERWNLMFLRHDSGPVYLWYEIVHSRFLRKTVDEKTQAGWDFDDIVVDSVSELGWRLRALYGLKNTLGKKIICIGGPGGWGQGGAKAPARTRELWKMDLVDFPYNELGKRIESAKKDQKMVSLCSAMAKDYVKQRGIKLMTDRVFVENAFLLNEVFKQIMAEEKTDAITVNQCMGTIMMVSKTTACLPLTLLNDGGCLAFCESDFVVIPSGVLLHYISGLPVFLCNPNYPHDNMITLAHCTAPRKMDGKRYEPALILTHFESDYGAAPKVEMRIGQECTCLAPDFASKRWIGMRGKILRNPFLDICRSQVDMQILGDAELLKREMRGFHWMVCYGNYLREVEYALRKAGVDFLNVSSSSKV